MAADVTSADPHFFNLFPNNNIAEHIFEKLITLDSDSRLIPGLAESWKAVTPTTWEFKLRKGVKFHDGSDFTADDVVFSFKRIVQPQGTMQIYVTGVKDVVKVDDHTVDFILSGPVPILLRNIRDFRIMSKTWAEKNRSANVQDYAKKEETYASRNVNGTGPYIIKGWEPDKQIVMTQNKNWWGKLDGNVSDVVYNPIKSDQTRVSALLAGDVDMVTDVPVQDVERLRKEAKVKVLDGHEVRTIFIGMDQHREELQYSNVKGKNPFKDVRVRRALNMAVDREAIKRVVMRGMSIPAGIMVAPGVHGHSKDIDVVMKPDPAGAKKLLAEAGYPDGLEFTLDCPNNRYVNDERICQALVGMWAKAGVRVRLNAMPFATFIAKIQNFDTSAYMLGWGVATFDALYTLQSLVKTKTGGAEGSFNLGRISNAKLDTTIDAIKIATDPKARDALLREGLVETRDMHYYVPIHHQLRPWAMKKSVSTVHIADDRPEARFTRVEGGI
jgi:peptide/nickel transport system substrate-binding protein